MKKIIIVFLLINISAIAQTKIEEDKKAIRSMAGCYKVTFDFSETFSPDTGYKYHNKYHSEGIEYVFVVEETDKKIVLQHLLIMGDTHVIKHWRQDWVYENTELLTYDKDNQWKKITLSKSSVKGQWTQRVFQVDDSPRYENTGTWVHVDGRHFWEATGDAPLPRREFTKRNDYNVLRRHNHIEINNNGWYLEQDNEKIIRTTETDKLLCWEKGMETFTKGEYNCRPAVEYWNATQKYWADVRKVWDEVFASGTILKLEKKAEGKFLYEKLFELAENYPKNKAYNSAEALEKIRTIILNHKVKI